MKHKKLPDSELEIMMILWQLEKPASRMDIEAKLDIGRTLSATTVLSFLSRLEEKGFVNVEKQKKTNLYTPIVKKEAYMQDEGKSILEKLYQNSVKNFVTSLYDGNHLSDAQLKELYLYLEEKQKIAKDKT